MSLKTTVIKIAIHPEDKNPVYDDGVLYLELVDEGAGAFLELSQGENKVAIDPEEFDVIAAADPPTKHLQIKRMPLPASVARTLPRWSRSQ